MVDEAGLHYLPLAEEAVAFGGSEIVDVEAVDALFARGEGGLSIAFGATFENSAVVLGAEAVAKMFGLLLALVDDDGYDHGDENYKYDDANDESGIIRIELHRFSLLRGDDGSGISCNK